MGPSLGINARSWLPLFLWRLASSASLGILFAFASAVALVASWWWHPSSSWAQRRAVSVEAKGYRDVIVWERVGAIRIAASFLRTIGNPPTSLKPERLPTWAGKPDEAKAEWWATSWAFGWPFPMIHGTNFEYGAQYPNRKPDRAELLFELRAGSSPGPSGRTPKPEWSGAVCLPIGMIPMGLCANSAIYGAFAWIAIGGWGHLRKWRRSVRRQCLRCGYDLMGTRDQSGSGRVCPECGSVAS
jgi:hypothetical protein